MKMKIAMTIEILKQHNKWRRGEIDEPLPPKTIGNAIDFAIKILKQKLKEEEDALPRTDPAILPPTEG